MKNIKLILLILFAFILIPVVNAEECDEEAINQMREELAKSDYSLKLEYNEKEKSMYAKIVDLPEGYSAYVLMGEEMELLSETEPAFINSGINDISFRNNKCNLEILSTTIKVPKYNPSKKNVFDDGSVVDKARSRINIKRVLVLVGLVAAIISLSIVAFLMIKGRLKNEK